MKAILRVVAMVAMAMVFTLGLGGCAEMPGLKTGIINPVEANIDALKKGSVDNTVYLTPMLYEAGFSSWDFSKWVGDKPELKPIKELVKFKSDFLGKIANIMKENGYSIIVVEKNPGGVTFAEIRIAGEKEIPLFKPPAAAARLYISHPFLKTPVEIYHRNVTFPYVLSTSGMDDEQFVGALAEKVASDMLKVLGK